MIAHELCRTGRLLCDIRAVFQDPRDISKLLQADKKELELPAVGLVLSRITHAARRGKGLRVETGTGEMRRTLKLEAPSRSRPAIYFIRYLSSPTTITFALRDEITSNPSTLGPCRPVLNLASAVRRGDAISPRRLCAWKYHCSNHNSYLHHTTQSLRLP